MRDRTAKLICILLPDLRIGGAERVNLDLAHEFARVGHEVEFLLMQAHGELLEEARQNFSVFNLSVKRVRELPVRLARYLRSRRPVVLIAAMWPLTVVAPLAARLCGHRCKVLVSEHGILSAQYRDYSCMHRTMLRSSMAVGYRLADRRVGVSKGLIEDIASLSHIRRDAFDVIHNPVRPHATPSKQAQQDADALWLVPKGERIITVGRMKAEKNYPMLLNAFARLDRPEARLMFVGDGEQREDLFLLAKLLNVADRVIFTGFNEDLAPFYETADLFVLSSDHEGFGNVIVEALSCGLPVVSTDCPSGPAEILDHGRYGRLVPVGHAAALAVAMDFALREPVDRDALISRAAEFTPELAARKYLELLELV